jgi:hypothetical protein
MKNTFIFLLFLTSASLQAQVTLYGQYVAGDSKEAVSQYKQTIRLNGMYYYIEPHFNDNNQLYKVRIINHDYVILSDYQVVLKHAERLVELMEHTHGAAIRNSLSKKSIRCGVDTPYAIAYRRFPNKDIRIDIECKDECYFHIVFTISAHHLSIDNHSRIN